MKRPTPLGSPGQGAGGSGGANRLGQKTIAGQEPQHEPQLAQWMQRATSQVDELPPTEHSQ